jgi:hypothetical protein
MQIKIINIRKKAFKIDCFDKIMIKKLIFIGILIFMRKKISKMKNNPNFNQYFQLFLSKCLFCVVFILILLSK